MELLNTPAPSVEAPSSLRASVMARVSQLPSPKDQNVFTRIIQSLSYKRAASYGFAAALSAALVLTAIFDHSLAPHKVVKSDIGIISPVTSSVSPSVFKSTSITPDNDKTLYNFALHLPANIPTGSMKAYVLKSDNVFDDNQSFSTNSDASLAWQSQALLKSTDTVTIPVAIPQSKDQEASALMFLIESQSASLSTMSRDLAIEPYGALPLSTVIPAGSSLIDTLKTICDAQDKQIYIDNSAFALLEDSHFALPKDTAANIAVEDILQSIPGITVNSNNSNSVFITAAN
jgi:hypothetical protein